MYQLIMITQFLEIKNWTGIDLKNFQIQKKK